MIDAPFVLVEPFAAQMAMPVSLLPYPPLLGIAFNLPASFFHDGILDLIGLASWRSDVAQSYCPSNLFCNTVSQRLNSCKHVRGQGVSKPFLYARCPGVDSLPAVGSGVRAIG